MQVINETMRIEPPVRYSSLNVFTEDLSIKGFTFLKGQLFFVPYYHLARNPAEWQSPEKFIPERFDPSSPYYLTPAGKKRTPASFSPFLGGRRVCIGKTFAENMAKVIIPIIVAQVSFEFVNQEFYERKPPHSLAQEPPFEVRVKRI